MSQGLCARKANRETRLALEFATVQFCAERFRRISWRMDREMHPVLEEPGRRSHTKTPFVDIYLSCAAWLTRPTHKGAI